MRNVAVFSTKNGCGWQGVALAVLRDGHDRRGLGAAIRTAWVFYSRAWHLIEGGGAKGIPAGLLGVIRHRAAMESVAWRAVAAGVFLGFMSVWCFT